MGLRKVHSAYTLVVAVLPDVPKSHHRILVSQGCIVYEIEPVYPPRDSAHSLHRVGEQRSMGDTLTRLVLQALNFCFGSIHAHLLCSRFLAGFSELAVTCTAI
jgi:hypothetical protein